MNSKNSSTICWKIKRTLSLGMFLPEDKGLTHLLLLNSTRGRMAILTGRSRSLAQLLGNVWGPQDTKEMSKRQSQHWCSQSWESRVGPPWGGDLLDEETPVRMESRPCRVVQTSAGQPGWLQGFPSIWVKSAFLLFDPLILPSTLQHVKKASSKGPFQSGACSARSESSCMKATLLLWQNAKVGGDREREGSGQKPPECLASLVLLCLVGMGTGVSARQLIARVTLCTDEERRVCFCKMAAGLPKKRIRPNERSHRISESPGVVATEHSVSEWAGDTVSKSFKWPSN